MILCITLNLEAVARRCSVKKVFLKILQNSQESTWVRASLLIKRALAELFSCEFCEIFKNNFFIEHPWRLLLKIKFSFGKLPVMKVFSKKQPLSHDQDFKKLYSSHLFSMTRMILNDIINTCEIWLFFSQAIKFRCHAELLSKLTFTMTYISTIRFAKIEVSVSLGSRLPMALNILFESFKNIVLLIQTQPSVGAQQYSCSKFYSKTPLRRGFFWEFHFRMAVYVNIIFVIWGRALL